MDRLCAPVLLGDGQPDEVRGMDREPDVTLGGESGERLTSLLLPREPAGEGEFEGAMALRDEIVEERSVVAVIGWEVGDAVIAIVVTGQSCQA